MPVSARWAPSIRAAAGPASAGTASVPAPASLPGPVRNGTTATRAGPASAATGRGGPGRGQATSATRAVARSTGRIIIPSTPANDRLEKASRVQYCGTDGEDPRPSAAPGMTRVLALIVGVAGGTLGGLVGLGGGFIMVPLMVYFLGMPQHEAQGTSLAILLPPVGVLSVLQYWRAGHVNIAVALWAAVGFLAGGWVGGTIAQLIAGRVLRRLFALLLLVFALDLFRR
ncbi:MAG: sulfite exporter TauE/SafE family protein [Deltaproteobacteria bacterium]|nr:MAG: sulfite exporter TauE/SafE family protein [Deltaproteobacteria bacterium]